MSEKDYKRIQKIRKKYKKQIDSCINQMDNSFLLKRGSNYIDLSISLAILIDAIVQGDKGDKI